jgi:hypothetical protein
MKRVTLTVTIACATWGCGQSDNAEWQQIENHGEAALFLDVSSVQQDGRIVIFWTKLDAPSWIERQFAKSEVRTKKQIDCASKTMRDVAGGVYVKGRLRYPFEKLLSGKIGPTGYGKLLYDRVC